MAEGLKAVGESTLQLSYLVAEIARSIVSVPDKVKVECLERQTGTIFRLRVDPSDLRSIIGRQGSTARCLRIILGAASKKFNQRIELEIVDEEGCS